MDTEMLEALRHVIHEELRETSEKIKSLEIEVRELNCNIKSTLNAGSDEKTELRQVILKMEHNTDAIARKLNMLESVTIDNWHEITAMKKV